MTELVLGIDPSLTATGLVVFDGEKIVKQELLSSKLKGISRVIDLEQKFIKFMTENKVSLVCIEGYAYGMTDGSMLASLGELGGALRMYMEKAGVRYLNVSPGTLKKFVTGKGNSKKQLMLMFTLQRWGIPFTDDNLCDAYGLSRIAHTVLQHEAGEKVTKEHTIVVKGIKSYDQEVNPRKAA